MSDNKFLFQLIITQLIIHTTPIINHYLPRVEFTSETYIRIKKHNIFTNGNEYAGVLVFYRLIGGYSPDILVVEETFRIFLFEISHAASEC